MNMLGRVTPITVTYGLTFQYGYWTLVQHVDGRLMNSGPSCETMEQAMREGAMAIAQGRPVMIPAVLLT